MNINGFFEEGESSPYNNEDDFTSKSNMINIPDSITLYAIQELQINDGVKCWRENQNMLHASRNIYCSVASESPKKEYAVNIGRSTIVRSIMSKGGIFLRDYSFISGMIKIYSLPNQLLEPNIQGNARIRTIPLCVLESQWPYKIAELPTTPTINNDFKEIFYNETYTLKNGDSFQTLKVHPGGTLLIEPGETAIGNIQLESGSKVQFVEPGEKTIIHLNGSTIWRSRTLNEDLEEVARGFMLIQHSNETMTVEGMWAGTIFAPNADLILGQSSKTLYGKFIGRNIAVHQYSNVYNVNFEPNELTELVLREN